MNTNQTMDEIWEEYKRRGDNVVQLDGHAFYRVLYAHVLEAQALAKKKAMSVFLTPGIALSSGKLLVDEKGSHFMVLGFEYLSFGDGGIPEWYIKSGPYTLRWIETPAIGNYISEE